MADSQKNAQESSDIRRSPRRIFERAVGVLCSGSYRLVQAAEISETGIRFSTETRIHKGARLVVSILMPGGDCIVVRAKVLREQSPSSRGYQYGCQFVGLGLHQRREIRSYVSAKTEAEAEIEFDDSKYI